MTIPEVRAKVERWHTNLLENARHDEREATRHYTGTTAERIKLGVLDMRHRAREVNKLLVTLRRRIDIEALLAEVQTQRRELLNAHHRLPPNPSYNRARRRLSIAARDCWDVILLLDQVMKDEHEAEED